jgi:DNA-binding transcriptional MocR family regulator
MIPETLESVLSDRLSRGLKMPKMLYLIPTGNNPSGTVISDERRKKIYDLACRYDFLIVEDDPYVFLSYSGVRIYLIQPFLLPYISIALGLIKDFYHVVIIKIR